MPLSKVCFRREKGGDIGTICKVQGHEFTIHWSGSTSTISNELWPGNIQLVKVCSNAETLSSSDSSVLFGSQKLLLSVHSTRTPAQKERHRALRLSPSAFIINPSIFTYPWSMITLSIRTKINESDATIIITTSRRCVYLRAQKLKWGVVSRLDPTQTQKEPSPRLKQARSTFVGTGLATPKEYSFVIFRTDWIQWKDLGFW